MTAWETMRLPAPRRSRRPTGPTSGILLATERGSCAHFELAGGAVSTAVVHRTVEEIWFFLEGRGQMWLASGEGEGEVVDVMPGDCPTIPVGTRFQFRAHETARCRRSG